MHHAEGDLGHVFEQGQDGRRVGRKLKDELTLVISLFLLQVHLHVGRPGCGHALWVVLNDVNCISQCLGGALKVREHGHASEGRSDCRRASGECSRVGRVWASCLDSGVMLPLRKPWLTMS